MASKRLPRPPGPPQPVSRMVASNARPSRSVVSHSAQSQVSSKNESTESGMDDSEHRDETTEFDTDDSENDSGIAPATVWVFNEGLKQVLHDIDHCRLCGEFAIHYSNAMIRLHPSYLTASLARKQAIRNDVNKQIDHRRSQLQILYRTISDRRQKLEGVCKDLNRARIHLESHRMKLKEVRRGLEVARQRITGAITTTHDHSSTLTRAVK